jgi:hypothetical protein
MTNIEKKGKKDPGVEPPRDPEIEFLGKAPKKKDNRITYLHPPLSKPGKKFDKEDKKENEMVRSFKIKI